MWWPLCVFNLCSFIFLGFQLFMFSKLGRLPICVICVTSLSVSFGSPPYPCHLCRLPMCVTLCVLQYMCHLCVTLCVSHCMCHIMYVILCESHVHQIMYITCASHYVYHIWHLGKCEGLRWVICVKYCTAHGFATRKNSYVKWFELETNTFSRWNCDNPSTFFSHS